MRGESVFSSPNLTIFCPQRFKMFRFELFKASSLLLSLLFEKNKCILFSTERRHTTPLARTAFLWKVETVSLNLPASIVHHRPSKRQPRLWRIQPQTWHFFVGIWNKDIPSASEPWRGSCKSRLIRFLGTTIMCYLFSHFYTKYFEQGEIEAIIHYYCWNSQMIS